MFNQSPAQRLLTFLTKQCCTDGHPHAYLPGHLPEADSQKWNHEVKGMSTENSIQCHAAALSRGLSWRVRLGQRQGRGEACGIPPTYRRSWASPWMGLKSDRATILVLLAKLVKIKNRFRSERILHKQWHPNANKQITGAQLYLSSKKIKL